MIKNTQNEQINLATRNQDKNDNRNVKTSVKIRVKTFKIYI